MPRALFPAESEMESEMNKPLLYGIVGILAIAVVVAGIGWYQEANTAHLDVRVDENGLSVDAN